nr:transposase [Thermoanaerobacter wiegelii]
MPSLCNGKLTTAMPLPEKRAGFLLTLIEMVVNGVSTRKIEEITYELCSTEFSKFTISEFCKNLNSIVTA